MEVIEWVVFLTVSVVIGALILTFVQGFDGERAYGSVSSILTGSESTHVTKEEFVIKTYNFWRSCGFGVFNDTTVYYITDSGVLNKSFIYEELEKLNLCANLRSSDNECGSDLGSGEEDMVFDDPIPIPDLIQLSCVDGKLEIS
ncbi:MAG: hypothetical protein ACMXYF_05275 [Candidatus Woesearchaeota archaeon]